MVTTHKKRIGAWLTDCFGELERLACAPFWLFETANILALKKQKHHQQNTLKLQPDTRKLTFSTTAL